MFRGGEEQLAHRFGYRLAFGRIPEGLCVCHSCDNPACQNPAHFFLGTPADNAADKAAKGRVRTGDHRGEKNERARFGVAQIRDIRRAYAAGMTQQELAERHHTTQGTISKIVRGERWRHVTTTAVDGRLRRVRGAQHPQATLTDAQVAKLRRRYAQGEGSQHALAMEYGISQQSVSAIVRKITRV